MSYADYLVDVWSQKLLILILWFLPFIVSPIMKMETLHFPVLIIYHLCVCNFKAPCWIYV